MAGRNCRGRSRGTPRESNRHRQRLERMRAARPGIPTVRTGPDATKNRRRHREHPRLAVRARRQEWPADLGSACARRVPVARRWTPRRYTRPTTLVRGHQSRQGKHDRGIRVQLPISERMERRPESPTGDRHRRTDHPAPPTASIQPGGGPSELGRVAKQRRKQARQRSKRKLAQVEPNEEPAQRRPGVRGRPDTSKKPSPVDGIRKPAGPMD